jgi:hypothetical protein
MYWNTAKTACDELILNGYSDWHLPSKEELNALYVNLKESGVGGFESNDYWSSGYWSSTEFNIYDAWLQYFRGGEQRNSDKYGSGRYNVRAVRAF